MRINKSPHRRIGGLPIGSIFWPRLGPVPKVAAGVLFAGQFRRSGHSLFSAPPTDPPHWQIGEAMTPPKRTPEELLASWVVARSSTAAADWFLGQLERLKGSPSEKDLYLALGYTTRKLGKGDLDLKTEERAAASAARPYWDPSDWSIDQAARLAFVLASQTRESAAFKRRLETLFNTADVWELIAFYRGRPLYPNAVEHVARAREGTRSAMQPIFEAVAHRNPFPMG